MESIGMIDAITEPLFKSFNSTIIKQALDSNKIITGELSHSIAEEIECECNKDYVAIAHHKTVYFGGHDAFKLSVYTSFKMFRLYVTALLETNKFNEYLGEWYGYLPLAKSKKILLAIGPDGSLLIQMGVLEKEVVLELNDDLRSKTNSLKLAFKN